MANNHIACIGRYPPPPPPPHPELGLISLWGNTAVLLLWANFAGRTLTCWTCNREACVLLFYYKVVK